MLNASHLGDALHIAGMNPKDSEARTSPLDPWRKDGRRSEGSEEKVREDPQSDRSVGDFALFLFMYC